MTPRRVLGALGAITLLGAIGTLLGWPGRDRFDHWEHRKVFPTCTGCHAGVEQAGAPVFPDPATCTSCHDGEVEKVVDWAPPAGPHPTNLDFAHGEHEDLVRQERGADSSLACVACHEAQGAPWMEVQRTVSRQCLDCHGLDQPHLAVADTACGTCHLTLAQAGTLTRDMIAAFPVPESHERPDFNLEGHGRLARGSGSQPVAESCATCHARDFCITCHVDAPEQRTIQALASDPRSLAVLTELREPPSHQAPDFLSRHGRQAQRAAADCRTCHTRESCLACHAVQPEGAVALASAGPGRGRGAVITRSRPLNHGVDFRETHAQPAATSPQSCTTCHTRTECLDCHRPTAAGTGDFHPAGFLVRHPVAAYGRETSCADCHNTTAFCADCHQQSGLVARGVLRQGFHDAKQAFLFGHGQAARQNLESCVSCHTERDCLTCHSATGGRRFNPHGPGWNPERLKKKNPETCTACHGINIP